MYPPKFCCWSELLMVAMAILAIATITSTIEKPKALIIFFVLSCALHKLVRLPPPVRNQPGWAVKYSTVYFHPLIMEG